MDTVIQDVSDFYSKCGGIPYILSNIVDFLILAFLIYMALSFFKGTRSFNVMIGIILFLGVGHVLVRFLRLEVLDYLLKTLWPVIGIVLLVIFQPEIRRALAQVSTIFYRTKTDKKIIEEIVTAVIQMSDSKTGALIVFERNIGLASFVNTAVQLDCKINALLLESIFFKNSPLHDCAVIIRDNKIVAAHAVLPLTQEDIYNPVRGLGTRHRAALGITEETDAVSLVVSEETGGISIAHKGRIIREVLREELEPQLKYLLMNDETPFGKLFAHAMSFTKAPASKPVQGDLFIDLSNQKENKK